ncbi:MAG: acyl carrier protein [Verrucomicrobiota bacterium]
MITKEKFLQELAQILGAPQGSITGGSKLADYSGWDSMGKMAVLTLIDSELNLSVPYDTLQNCHTVGDLLEFVSPHIKS